MPNKLQELTDRLYNEGLAKGREEGEAILAQAREKAALIEQKARDEAEAIVEAARRQAADIRSKTESDVRMASAQMLEATRQDISNILVNAVCADKVDAALKDTDFIKTIIRTVAERFSTTETADIALILPASMQAGLEPWIKAELAEAIGGGIRCEFSKKVAGGFSIGPGDGSWFISLTDDTFRELAAEYLRPVTKKLLFG